MTSGFTFGGAAPAATAAGGFSFTNSQTTQASQPAFSFGTPAQPAVAVAAAPTGAALSTAPGAAPGFSLASAAAVPQKPAGGFNFGAAPAAATMVAPALGQSTGFGFATNQTQGASLASAAAQPFQLRITSTVTNPLAAPATTTTATLGGASTGFFAPKSTAATLSLGATAAPALSLGATAPKAGALAGFGATATATGIFAKAPAAATTTSMLGGLLQAPTATATPNLPQLAKTTLQAVPTAPPAVSLTTGTTTTSSAAAPPTMNYRQLEEEINKWSVELQDQEKIFIQQATQVNAWDRMLIDNGEKISELNADVDRVKLDQQRLDGELDFINAQQRELEEMLMPLEQTVEQMPPITFQQHADLEREHTYKLSENIDAQLKRMVQDLKEIIDHMNTSNTNTDAADPAQQIAKILNAHMHSLQWIDSNTALLQRRVDDVARVSEHRKKEQERNFRLAYD